MNDISKMDFSKFSKKQKDSYFLLACKNDYYQIVEDILATGYNPTRQKHVAIEAAVKNSSVHVLKIIFQHKKCIKHKNKFNELYLEAALLDNELMFYYLNNFKEKLTEDNFINLLNKILELDSPKLLKLIRDKYTVANNLINDILFGKGYSIMMLTCPYIVDSFSLSEKIKLIDGLSIKNTAISSEVCDILLQVNNQLLNIGLDIPKFKKIYKTYHVTDFRQIDWLLKRISSMGFIQAVNKGLLSNRISSTNYNEVLIQNIFHNLNPEIWPTFKKFIFSGHEFCLAGLAGVITPDDIIYIINKGNSHKLIQISNIIFNLSGKETNHILANIKDNRLPLDNIITRKLTPCKDYLLADCDKSINFIKKYVKYNIHVKVLLNYAGESISLSAKHAFEHVISGCILCCNDPEMIRAYINDYDNFEDKRKFYSHIKFEPNILIHAITSIPFKRLVEICKIPEYSNKIMITYNLPEIDWLFQFNCSQDILIKYYNYFPRSIFTNIRRTLDISTGIRLIAIIYQGWKSGELESSAFELIFNFFVKLDRTYYQQAFEIIFIEPYKLDDRHASSIEVNMIRMYCLAENKKNILTIRNLTRHINNKMSKSVQEMCSTKNIYNELTYHYDGVLEEAYLPDIILNKINETLHEGAQYKIKRIERVLSRWVDEKTGEEFNHDGNNMIVFHGTSLKNSNGILLNGFKQQYNKRKAFGTGTYTSLHWCKAMNYCPKINGVIMICRVDYYQSQKINSTGNQRYTQYTDLLIHEPNQVYNHSEVLSITDMNITPLYRVSIDIVQYCGINR